MKYLITPIIIAAILLFVFFKEKRKIESIKRMFGEEWQKLEMELKKFR